MSNRVGKELARAALVLGCVATTACVASAQSIGPSTTTAPYVLPSMPGVETVSVLTVGDTIGGYSLVGIPDGLGAFKNGHRTMNYPAASRGVSSSPLARHSVLDTESSRALWIPASAGTTNSRQAAGNETLAHSRYW